jgi:ribosomal protein S27AE
MALSITLSTLQSYRDADEIVRAHCYRCGYARVLDLDALIARFGGSFDLVQNNAAFCSRLVCGRCGKRGGGITLTPRITGGMG